MANKGITKISNSISTGGGGVNFEQNIQAMFLLSLMIDGFCPAMNEKTKKVCFQAKHLGYAVDDLVVFTERKLGEGKLLCQMKRAITVSQNNSVFYEVMEAAWHDFCDEKFDKKKDKIALAVAEIAVGSLHALRFLNNQANGSSNEEDFIHRVYLANFSNANTIRVFETIKACITSIEENVPTDFELWTFCRAFIVILFDLDYKEGVNRTLAMSLIMHRSSLNPLTVWAELVHYAGFCNQGAFTIDLSNIDDTILDLFRTEPKTIYTSELHSEMQTVDLELNTELSGIIESETELPVIALIGSWDEGNVNDCKTVEEIIGIKYKEFIKTARSILGKYPDIITLTNGHWKVTKKTEILEKSECRFFDENIENLFSAASKIFLQKSNRIDQNNSGFLYNKSEYDNSGELRRNLLLSLCWLKKHKENLKYVTQSSFDHRIFDFVDRLLDKCGWETIVSLRNELPLLAELSPEAFLRDVESSLVDNRDEIIRLFPKTNENALFSSNYLPSLLFALDVLSWDPKYLTQSVLILARLESLPHDKTNVINTPINSIISVFLPWLPQTVADFSKRKIALSCLQHDNPEVFWRVLSKLLPGQTKSTVSKQRPCFLPIFIPEKIQVTDEDIVKQNLYYIELAVDFSKDSVEKITFLIDYIRYMRDSVLDKFISNVEKNINNSTEEELYSIWKKLNNNFDNVTPLWKKENKRYCSRIISILETTEPKNILQKYKELFIEDNNSLIDSLEEKQKTAQSKKISAIKDIYQAYGVAGVERFARTLQDLFGVADIFSMSISSDALSDLLNAYEKRDVTKDFALICINSCLRNGVSIKTLEKHLQKCSNEIRKDILVGIPYMSGLDEVIDNLLSDESLYWENVPVTRFLFDKDVEIFKYYIDKLIRNHRLIAAVNMVGYADFQNIYDSAFLVELLKKTGAEASKGKDKLDEFCVKKIIDYIDKDSTISIAELSDLEWIYYPLLSYDDKIPHSLSVRIGTDPLYFCEIIETFFKRRNYSVHTGKELPKSISERLASIILNFNVVPGVDRNGLFSSDQFDTWIKYVIKWSKENDRYEVAMHTVGSGLSYAHNNGEELPPLRIIEELEKIENNDLRIGYKIGVFNQRGAYFVDPEGKPEFELAKKYKNMGTMAEEMGYSRYSQTLMEISEQYEKEGRQHVEEARSEMENGD